MLYWKEVVGNRSVSRLQNVIKYVFLSFVFLMLHRDASFAQNRSGKRELFATISLEQYKMDISPGMPIKKITVIPSLWDSSGMGFVQVGLGNKRIRAIADKDYQSFLQGYIDREYKNQLKSDGIHLLFVIRDLRITERTFTFSELAYVRLRADVWLGNNGDGYSFAGKFDTVLVRGGMEVTAKHAKNIANAFNLLINYAAAQSESVLKDPNTKVLNKEDIIALTGNRFNIPALSEENLIDGVYTRFSEFLNNQPRFTDYDITFKKRKTKILIGPEK